MNCLIEEHSNSGGKLLQMNEVSEWIIPSPLGYPEEVFFN